MPLWTAEALAVRHYDLGEADRIVVLLTRDRGKKRGVARGARRPRSPFAAAFEPLTHLLVTCVEREGGDLVRLRSAEVLASLLAGPAPAALGYAEYFAELLDAAAPEAEPNERLFRLAAATAEALRAGVSVEPLARYFEYWLLRLQGVYPAITACAACGVPFGADGAVLVPGEWALRCPRCQPGEGWATVSAAGLAFLGAAARTSPRALAGLSLTQSVATELAAAHRLLLAAHLERELKSVRVLRELAAVWNPT
jgi:DNA repair protein RecO (recombination protein O)